MDVMAAAGGELDSERPTKRRRHAVQSLCGNLECSCRSGASSGSGSFCDDVGGCTTSNVDVSATWADTGSGITPAMVPVQAMSFEYLKESELQWTVIRGHAYDVGDFIPHHPGGELILRCIGEDGTDIFDAHHHSRTAYLALVRHKIGYIHNDSNITNAGPGLLRLELNRRVTGYLEASKGPVAELVAIATLCCFVLWSFLAYTEGWTWMNIMLSWFWARHLDAGLHAALHGDFAYLPVVRRGLLQIYSILCHHILEYYQGSSDGKGLSQHFQHHVRTNELLHDPDMTGFIGERNWIRRHPSNPWRAYHAWQHIYWLPVICVLEPVSELLTMLAACVMAATQLLEPPLELFEMRCRWMDAASWWLEALLSPEYQGLSFCFRPWRQALGVLLASKAVAKIVLMPFAEVQHLLLPEIGEADQQEEFVVKQLRSTCNLRMSNPLARLLDFLMFHGDSLQIEHHLWPALSFTQLRRASKLLRTACIELELPYQELGYWQAFGKIWEQVRLHAKKPKLLSCGSGAG
eukprot:TRINITY_DN60301_c0_g1_i1.p1 TRINITY_DN60301_c0_g1~~TRINITY_DN60301_c0_g1_i1.p1  ORF type:complete len:521 (-),score=47.73 TRINITY_DN60301_c0_g1_i1:1-1563(-)